jgi:hypothetical protein
VSEERCPRTELLVTNCAHCRPVSNLPLEGHDLGPVFDANFPGRCVGCERPIRPDDPIRACDGEYIHAGCEPR